MNWFRALALAATAAVGCQAGRAAAAPCADLVHPFPAAKPGSKRPITLRDIVEMRAIGSANASMYGFADRLAVSPNGRQVAFALIRADVASNMYCQAIYVTDLRAGAEPRPVNAGGDRRQQPVPLRGYLVVGGDLAPTVPVWAPGGRTIAFLRADRGATQAWIAESDGSGSRAVTSIPGGVTAVGWTADGSELLVARSPSSVAEQAAIDREGARGWHYDARTFASFQLRPLLSDQQRYEIVAVDLVTGATRPATTTEAARIGNPSGAETQAPAEAVAVDGRRAWGERAGGGARAPIGLKTSDAAGRRHDCNADWCRTGIYRLWWEPDGESLFIQRREGRGGEIAAFYHWVPGQPHARRFFATSDVVQDCVWAAAGFACTRENATTPRHIVVIDRNHGRSTTIFDPNPEFAAIALGPVRRFHVTNQLGLDSWGDLVLPPDYRPGQKLPLVVVQYKSQGFLRGGVGDEYPIYPMAQRGFAVLSIERPPFASSTMVAATTSLASNAANSKDWADRRNVLSSLELILDRVIATGAIDPKRIGITGLSDGASTVRFAMLNSKRFAAAAISTCCLEPGTSMAVNGPAFASYFQKLGFPPLTRPDAAFWADFSLARHGDRTNTPLLLQLADREANSALETYQAMREFGKPVDMFIFPDEYHIKWQPRAKLAVGERAVDWFAFWLQDKVDPAPAKREQYRRWAELRAQRVRIAPPR